MTTLDEIANELRAILGKNFTIQSNVSFQDLKLAFLNVEPMLTDDQIHYFNELLDQHASSDDVFEDDADDEYDYACDGPGWCKECGPVDE
jgi:hypothetical protein